MHLKRNEHDFQKNICKMLTIKHIFYFETDVMDGLKFCNTEKMRMAFISHHKQMGYVKGQSDLIILLPKRIVFVELKNGKQGRQSDSQKAFQKKVEELGFEYQIWRDLEDCRQFILKEVNK